MHLKIAFIAKVKNTVKDYAGDKTYKIENKNKQEQAGAELCQAKVKLEVKVEVKKYEMNCSVNFRILTIC